MYGIIRCAKRAGKTVSRHGHRGIEGADQRKVCVPGCLSEMFLNRLDREGAGDLACVAAAHAVTDGIESERRVGHKAILVVRPLEPGIGFGAMQLFECQTRPPLGCETLQAGAEFTRELICAPVAVRQFFL